MAIEAQRRGKCRACGESIEPGMLIVRADPEDCDGGWIHEECEEDWR